MSKAKNKKLISDINKMLKENDMSHLKVAALHLEVKNTKGGQLNSSCSDECEDDEVKIEIRKPDGSTICKCVKKTRLGNL